MSFLFKEYLINITQNKPDEIIYSDNKEYMYRWYIKKDKNSGNIYLHSFLLSDDDRAQHDHPWPSLSFIVQGSYLDHIGNDTFLRQEGDIVFRDDKQHHRVELIDNKPAITLFITGSKTKDWGFFCPEGKVHHVDYHNQGGCAT